MDSNNMDNPLYQNRPEDNQDVNNNQGEYQNTYQSTYQNAYQTEASQNQNYQSNYQPNYQPYQGNYYNGNYQMPYQQEPPLDLEEPVKMGEWLICLLIMIIPCVNIIMMFVWAFSKTEKKSKSNLFKAYLVMFGIIFALYLVLIILIMALGITSSVWY